MNKIKKFLWSFPLLWVSVAVTPAYSAFIYFQNGSSIKCEKVWKGTGDYVWIRKSHGIVGYPLNDVDLKATFGEDFEETPAKKHSVEDRHRKEELIRELWELSGMKKQVAQLGELAAAGLNEEYQQGRLPSDFYQYLFPLTKDAYNVDKIRRDLLERIEKDLDSECIEAVLTWLRSPLGRKVTSLEEAATTPEGLRLMQTFAAELETNPPSQARLRLVKRLDVATNASDMMLDMATITVHQVMNGVIAIMPMTPGLDQNALELHMSAKRELMRQVFQQAAMITYLYTYQSLSDDEFDRYITFAESDDARRYHGAMFQEFKEIQSEVALNLAIAVNEAFRDLAR